MKGAMRIRFVLLACGILLGAETALAGKPIMNIHDRAVPVNVDGSGRTIDEVRAAVIEGCKLKGWTPVMNGENEIKCSIDVRGRHYAEVLIAYTAEHFSIVYSGSRGLEYNEKKQRIHRNYNRWVANLALAIQQQF